MRWSCSAPTSPTGRSSPRASPWSRSTCAASRSASGVPVRVPLVGTVKDTADALLPLLEPKTSSAHLDRMTRHYRRTRARLDRLARPGRDGAPLHPQHVAATVDKLAAADAVFTADVGTPCIWAARYLHMNGTRRLIGSFNHGSMANALPHAIGAPTTGLASRRGYRPAGAVAAAQARLRADQGLHPVRDQDHPVRRGIRARRARPDQPAGTGRRVTSASDPVTQPSPARPTGPSGRPGWPRARAAVVECVVLAVACLITYWLATRLLSRVQSVGRDDDLLGGMWAVLATIFVLRDSFGKSVAAAVSRMAATSVSFVLCLIYLAFLPFQAWALAVLVGASALVVMLLGRPGDAVTAGITTAVIMVVAAVSPQDAWQQPILRLADTVVGALAAWTATRIKML